MRTDLRKEQILSETWINSFLWGIFFLFKEHSPLNRHREGSEVGLSGEDLI